MLPRKYRKKWKWFLCRKNCQNLCGITVLVYFGRPTRKDLSTMTSSYSINFNQLPNELTTHIFSFLGKPTMGNVGQLGNAALVCRQWRQLAENPDFWDEVLVIILIIITANINIIVIIFRLWSAGSPRRSSGSSTAPGAPESSVSSLGTESIWTRKS